LPPSFVGLVFSWKVIFKEENEKRVVRRDQFFYSLPMLPYWLMLIIAVIIAICRTVFAIAS
jgi:hypothetical protein